MFHDIPKNLEILAEESAEIIDELFAMGKILSNVIKIKSKIVRFGMADQYPADGPDNRARLEQEIGDFLAMVDILTSNGVLTPAGLEMAKKTKLEKLQRWYR
jgi:hypothetical protein